MSGISSSIGLISGLPTQDLIAQLMAIEARPVQLLQQRVLGIQSERTAYADLGSRLLSLKNAVQQFDDRDFFGVSTATASDPGVLTATAGADAAFGTFGFRVNSLVSSHELISRGFADRDAAVGAGTMSLEIGGGSLSDPTQLESLLGGAGVRRGKIEITDREGNRAEIDLTTALSVSDVIDEINAATNINVKASVSADRIVLTDQTGATTNNLAVRDLAGGFMAADLGMARSVAADTIDSKDLIFLTNTTQLVSLNDGNGIARSRVGDDFVMTRDDGSTFNISLSGNVSANTQLAVLNGGNAVRLGTIRITDRNGETADVDLTGAKTLGEIAQRIEDSPLNIDVTYFNSSSSHALQIRDDSGGSGALKIEDVTGFAAADLGINTEVESESIVGSSIHSIRTVGDVLRTIQYAVDNNGLLNEGRITARIADDGNGLVLSGNGFPRGFTVTAAVATNGIESPAARDLGILGRYDDGVHAAENRRHLLAGIDTVLLANLNGGAGIAAGTVRITAADGATADIDLTDAQTVQQIIERINAASATSHVTASLNTVGHGILLRDDSGIEGDLIVSDISGSAAADLNLLGTHSGGTADSGNLQHKYVSGQSPLTVLNNGRGIRNGSFRITNAAGAVASINITDSQRNLGDVMNQINSANISVVASINANGDGLLLTDNSGGAASLKVEDLNGGSTAADLRIAGQAQTGTNIIDGAFEINIEVDGRDTLASIAEKINAAGADVSATVINDGGAVSPYRLVVTSKVTGERGKVLFDAADVGIEFSTLVEGRDAVVFFGGDDAAGGVLLRSSTNSLDGVLEDVNISLVGTSDETVTLTVAQDIDSIVADVNDFVTKYNEVQDRIDTLTSFDSDTFERGVLFGSSTVSTIERRLHSGVTTTYGNNDAFQRLLNIGITLEEGSRLAFDEERFRDAYAEDPDAVEALLTEAEIGFGAAFNQALDDMTRGFDGLLARTDDSLEGQEELFNQRIAGLNVLLDRKEERLQRQFAGLETALAGLQGAQSSLLALQSLAG